MIAHILTSIRLLLAIPVAWACAQPQALPPYFLLGLIAVAIVTDYFDGKIARMLRTESPGGMLFDHGTDFVFVTSALFGAAFAGLVSPWLPILIVIAFTQYVLDSYWLLRQKRLRMSMLGRWNGIFYFSPLILIGLLQTEIFNSVSSLLQNGLVIISFVLILSTLASIIDRAIAPLRAR